MHAMSPIRLLFALILAAPGALAQDPAKPAPKPEVKPEGEPPIIHVPLPAGMEDARQKMIKLFGEVETRLRQIDKLLSEAAAGERGVQDTQKQVGEAAAGIGALVKRTQDEGKAVVEAIDKILDLAAQQQQQEGQGGSSSQGSGKTSNTSQGAKDGQQGEEQGKSPLEGQRDTTTQRESTPDKPGSEKGKQPDGKQPDQGGSPKGNKKTPGDGKNTTSKAPPGMETEKNAHGADSRE